MDSECLWMENVDGERSWTESVCHKDGKCLWTRTFERLTIMEDEPWRTIREGECLWTADIYRRRVFTNGNIHGRQVFVGGG